jgi:hypothetical protein
MSFEHIVNIFRVALYEEILATYCQGDITSPLSFMHIGDHRSN